MSSPSKEVCPRCGTNELIPISGGINEYDSRQYHLPSHKDPTNHPCKETNITIELINFVNRSHMPKNEVKQTWPFLKIS